MKIASNKINYIEIKYYNNFKLSSLLFQGNSFLNNYKKKSNI